MSRHNEMPPVPPLPIEATKGAGDNDEISKEMAKTKPSEYRQTRRYRPYQAEHHIKRNTTNAGFLQGTASEVTPN
jgi:hypothetical protein